MKTRMTRLTNLLKTSYAACINPQSSALTGAALLLNTLLVPVVVVAVLVCNRE